MIDIENFNVTVSNQKAEKLGTALLPAISSDCMTDLTPYRDEIIMFFMNMQGVTAALLDKQRVIPFLLDVANQSQEKFHGTNDARLIDVTEFLKVILCTVAASAGVFSEQLDKEDWANIDSEVDNYLYPACKTMERYPEIEEEKIDALKETFRNYVHRFVLGLREFIETGDVKDEGQRSAIFDFLWHSFHLNSVIVEMETKETFKRNYVSKYYFLESGNVDDFAMFIYHAVQGFQTFVFNFGVTDEDES